jgi:hypothetical protein
MSPPLPRCVYHETPRDDCAICDAIRQGRVPAAMVVVAIHRPPLTLRRFLADMWPVLAGALVLGIGTSTTAGWLGASPLLQFGLCLAGAVVGMFGAAVLLDHVSGRRRLWGPRLPPAPPRAMMPEQIPEPRDTT